MGMYLKDPRSRLDYAVEWTGNIGSETITTSQWSVEPAPVEADGLRIVATFREDGRTAATLEGGIAGTCYRVCNTISRSDGRVDARSIVIRVEDR